MRKTFIVIILVLLFSILIEYDFIQYLIPRKIQVGISQFGYIGFLQIVLSVILDKIRGKNRMMNSRKEWYRLLGVLDAFDKEYINSDRGIIYNDDIAEAHLLGFNLLNVGMDLFLHNADPLRPRFRDVFNPNGYKWLVDNPDTFYFTAMNLHQDLEYKVIGEITDEVYVSLTVYSHKELGSFSEEIVSESAYPSSSLSGTVLYNDTDSGYFKSNGQRKIWKARLSKLEPDDLEENEVWLKLPSDPKVKISCLTRHYFEYADSPAQLKDELQHKIPLTIQLHQNEKLNTFIKKTKMKRDLNYHNSDELLPSKLWNNYPNKVGPPKRLKSKEIAERMKWVSNFVASHSLKRIKVQSDPNAAPSWYSLKANTIGKPGLFVSTIDDTKGIGAPDVGYSAGPWKLQKDEALVIDGIIPNCIFGNVLMMNRFLQTLSYEYGRHQSFNRKQLKNTVTRQDGSLIYRIVVAHRNPGPKHNWLDTEERKTGVLFYRFMLPDLNTTNLKPNCTVVKFPLNAKELIIKH